MLECSWQGGVGNGNGMGIARLKCDKAMRIGSQLQTCSVETVPQDASWGPRQRRWRGRTAPSARRRRRTQERWYDWHNSCVHSRESRHTRHVVYPVNTHNTQFQFLKQIPSLYLNPEVHFRLYGRHLEKSIWRHNSAADRPITTKFGKQMQNDILMTVHRLKSEPQIEFQYGGRPFSKTGSSFISAVVR